MTSSSFGIGSNALSSALFAMFFCLWANFRLTLLRAAISVTVDEPASASTEIAFLSVGLKLAALEEYSERGLQKSSGILIILDVRVFFC
jgi:hypothetical protein